MRVDQDPSVEEQRPIKQSFCRSLRRDTHWKCLILTLLISGCLAAISWCRLSVVTKVVTMYSTPYHKTSRTSPCEDGYIYIPVAFVVMLYLVYLVECWHCHTRLELQCKVDVNTVYERIQAMREAIPIVWWKAVCYHYVRRTRQVTRYRNGDAFTTTQVYYERVNSHTASSCFNFTACGLKDISKRLLNLEAYPATKIKFTKGFSFSAYDAEQEFEEQRAHFFHTHERMDDYMETREGLDLMNVNFKEYMICFADPDNLPWYISQVVFWTCSILLMSWPLRVLIEFKTAYVHFHVHKLFGANYSADGASLCHGSGRMPRVNTMESSEMELNIRGNNYTMVPSYSEALLMECADTELQHQQQQLPAASGYGAVTTPGGSMPLVHIGNSICIAPAMNSSYLSNTPLPNGAVAGAGTSPSAIYQNMQANGYIPLPGGGGGIGASFSSTDTLSNVQRRRRRKRRRKRRRQSYTDAIQAPSDSDGGGVASQRAARSHSQTPTTTTPESASEHDNATLPSRDSSLDALDDSEGADNPAATANGQDLTSANSKDVQNSTRGAENVLVTIDDSTTTPKTSSPKPPPSGDSKEPFSPGVVRRPVRPVSLMAMRDSPPAYELALAMTRAGLSTAIPTAMIPGRVTRQLPDIGAVTTLEPRPGVLLNTRTRLPDYLQEGGGGHGGEPATLRARTDPPIKLMETSL